MDYIARARINFANSVSHFVNFIYILVHTYLLITLILVHTYVYSIIRYFCKIFTVPHVSLAASTAERFI